MDHEVVIVEVLLPQAEAVLLQSLLQGEDGLATIRCLDPEKEKQQCWTTPEQLDELYRWLDSLPNTLHVEVTGEWRWQEVLREGLWKEGRERADE